jgi:chain length determinant protein tyrosine kinase EpsG
MMSMQTLDMLLQREGAAAGHADAASPDRVGAGPGEPIGRLLLERGRLGEREVERILQYARRKNLRFGEAAVKLGFIGRADLDRVLSAQFGYPYLERGAGGLSARLVAAFDPFSGRGNALRILAAQLQQRWFAHGQRALCVVSPGGRDGCSELAANLAVIFSQLGAATVLVDAGLQEPAQHVLFNAGNAVGLSSALAGRADIESQRGSLPRFPALDLVPAGPAPPNVHDLLRRPELDGIVSRLSSRYAVVIFDAPPHLANLGAEDLARRCGGALLVVRRNHTRLDEVRQLLDALSGQGVVVVGSVIKQS